MILTVASLATRIEQPSFPSFSSKNFEVIDLRL
jgi:hypothetical protein